jgi:hypothetical protein
MANSGFFRGFVSFVVKNRFYVVGSFFLIFQLLILYQYIFLARFDNMLWFCSHAPLLFAIGFFSNNKTLIKSLICVGLFIQFFWIVDYLGMLFFGVFIFGATGYMFNDMHSLAYAISVVEHFLSAPLALLLVYRYRNSKEIFLYSFVYLAVILLLSLAFGAPEYNYNFVHFIPVLGDITFPGYVYAWIFLAMVIIVVPSYYFQVFLYNLYKKRKEKKRKIGEKHIN